MKKSIAKNYLYNVSYQILVMILPIITTPYVSRVLGAERILVFIAIHCLLQLSLYYLAHLE